MSFKYYMTYHKTIFASNNAIFSQGTETEGK